MLLAAPFLVCNWPPLVDLPNHLARYHLIASAHAGVSSPYFQVVWDRAGTNLGGDALAFLSSPVLNAEGLARVLVWLSVLGPPVGALVLSLRLTGRLQAWQALVPISAWMATSLMGFINFQIGLAFALLFTAWDRPISHGRTGVAPAALRAAASVVLAFIHSFALIFYLALLSALAWGPRLRPPLKPTLARILHCVVPALAGLTAPLWLGRPLPGGGALGAQFDAWPGRLLTPFTPLTTYALPLDAVILVASVVVITVALRRQALRLHAGLGLLAGVLMTLAVFTPAHAFGASWLDRRLPPMALLALLAGADWAVGARWRPAAAAALFTGIVAAKTAVVATAWRADESLTAEVRGVLANAPIGARVAPVQIGLTGVKMLQAPLGRYVFGVGDPVFRHLAAWTVTDRNGFEPMLFAARGLQPLAVRQPWALISDPNGGPLLDVADLKRRHPPGYLHNWRRDFDFILVLNRDYQGPQSMPPGLAPVQHGRFAELLRVIPADAAEHQPGSDTLTNPP